jgi:O-antigen/teichoic acid export membrane protein/ubiquinone/menaquinone biosynthesis C-methylase UbiE
MALKSSGHIIARNTLYTFATQLVVGIIALLSIPILVTKLGDDIFGLLTIIWMIVGYLGILDLGIGQASVKFLAGQIAANDLEGANSTFWGTLGINIILAFVISILCIVLFPFVIGLTKVSDQLLTQIDSVMWWIVLVIPIIMMQSALRALPTAMQRLDTVNIIQAISGLFQWGGSVVVLLCGGGLRDVVILTVFVRIISASVFYRLDMRLFPSLAKPKIIAIAKGLGSLIRYGVWINISQIVSPIVKYLDRALIASYLPLRMFTYYVIPYEAMSRLQIIPASISTSLFPALAEKEGSGSGGDASIKDLYFRATNFMVLIMLPVTLVLVAFSNEILLYWLGGSFPALSSRVFQILAIGTFVQAIGYIPLTTLQAAGKPEIAAKFYLIEIPLYILLCFMLIPRWGLTGAAYAFLLRLTIIVSALLWATHRSMLRSQSKTFSNRILRVISLNGVLLILILVLAQINMLIIHRLMLLAIMLGGYAISGWFYCLEDVERKTVRTLLSVNYNHWHVAPRERLTPIQERDMEFVRRHISRYEFAARYIKGRTVLDMACGTGYGALMLANFGACKVMGVDISADAVQYARKYHAGTNVNYEVGDAQNFVIPEGVDIITSFETIEHIVNPDDFLLSASKSLKKEGMLIISTPIRRWGTLNTPPKNIFHQREWSESEFFALLKKYFTQCETFYQYDFRKLTFPYSRTISRMLSHFIYPMVTKEFLKYNVMQCPLPMKGIPLDREFMILVCSNSPSGMTSRDS